MKIVHKGQRKIDERVRLLTDPVPHYWQCVGCKAIVLATYSEMIDRGDPPRADGKPNRPRMRHEIKEREAVTICPFCTERNLFWRSFGDRGERVMKFLTRQH